MQDAATIYVFTFAYAIYHFLSELDASSRPLGAHQPFCFHAVLMELGFETDVILRQSPRQWKLPLPLKHC